MENRLRLLEQEPLCNHTTFRIGGPARYYAVPESSGELKESIAFAREKGLPYMILGKGSNVLFSDEGYPGVVIEVGRGMEQIQCKEGHVLEAQAGAGLGALAGTAARQCLAGLEFASGIPGTVGGAVVMNAGAYGGEIQDVFLWAEVMDESGTCRRLEKEEMAFGYRSSIVQKNKYIVLEAAFLLEPGNGEEILASMRDLNARRREKQPLEYASAGSTFKRPQGNYAGKLIEEAGLRGFSVGDAQVSEKHCGFVINRGNATSLQVRQLMEEVQKRVYESSGVKLEPEVKVIL